MAPLLRPLFYYLWITPHLLQVVILFVMIRRKLYRQFPIFLCYTAFELCQFIILFVVAQFWSLADGGYYGAFSLGSAISVMLRFGVIHEIFTHVFRNYGALNELGRVLFRWATVVLLLIAVAFAASTQGDGSTGPVFIIYVLERTANLLQCGLLLFLFLFSRYFGLSWRNCAFGIALGFGIFASVGLVTSAIGSRIGSGSYLLDSLVMATYHCCVLIWIFYLVVPERSRYSVPKKLPDHDLETWNRELERLLEQ